MEKKIQTARALLHEVFLEMEKKDIVFKTYPQELPSFDELVIALGEVEIMEK